MYAYAHAGEARQKTKLRENLWANRDSMTKEQFDRANVILECGVCHGRLTRDNKMKRTGWIDIASDAVVGGD